MKPTEKSLVRLWMNRIRKSKHDNITKGVLLESGADLEELEKSSEISIKKLAIKLFNLHNKSWFQETK